MPNNTRTQLDAVWTAGSYAPLPSDWQDLEKKVFGSWNGDQGGSYCAPGGATGSAYTINGAGLQVLGPTRLTYGGAIKGGSGAFVIRDGTWPALDVGHAGRSRSIVQPIETIRSARAYMWSRNHPYCGVGSVALAMRETNTQTVETSDLFIPLRVVDGSVLGSVKLVFRVASRRGFAPIAMPKMRVMRIPYNSGANSRAVLPETLKTTSDGSGFDFTPLVTSPDTWYANGAPQSFTYVCDKNNVIDTSKYTYMVHLVEEVGILTFDDAFDGIRYVERKSDADNFSDVALGVTGTGVAADGGATSAGRFLVAPLNGGSDPKNGLYAGNVGTPWVRQTDLDDANDFTPNWVVRVRGSIPSAGIISINAGALWQCQYPRSQGIRLDATGKLDPAMGILIAPAQPFGNIYHALVPTFSVTDLRFQ